MPPEFRDIHLMRLTGLSYTELAATPEDVIVRLAIYLNVRHVAENGGEYDPL